MIGELREAHLSIARAEAGLRRQAHLIELSHDAIITLDAGKRISAWNAGAEEMYGWTRAEASGSRIDELLQTSSSLSTAAIDEILLREGRWEGELNHVARDGRHLRVESRQIQVRGEENQSAWFLEINRDITRRMQSEEALRESEGRYSALFGNTINAIAHCRVVTDADVNPIDYEIVEVNRAHEVVTGLKKEDIEGKRARQVFPGIGELVL